MNTHSSTSSRLYAALVASLAFSLAAMVAAFGLAGLAGDSVRGWFKTWEAQRHVSDVRQWHQAYSRLALAHRLNPLNAGYSAELGRLMEWNAWRQRPGSPEYVHSRSQAERYYGTAIAARPGWGYAWAHRAENRLLQGKADREFLRALEMAIVHGPWEPWVQKKVAWIGMATWNELPPRMRPIVKESIRRTVELGYFPNEIVRSAIQYGWLDHLQPMLRTEPQRRALAFVREQLDVRW